MTIGPVSGLHAAAPVNPSPTPQDGQTLARQLVIAVQAINQSELMGPNRQLVYTRDARTQQPVIHIVARDTGDVIDQLPAEAILRLRQDIEPQELVAAE